MVPVDEIKHAIINKTTSGDATIVAAAPARRIKVLHFTCGSDGQNRIRWKSDGAIFLTGPMQLFGNGMTPLVSPYVSPTEGFLFATEVNQALVLNSTVGTMLGGWVTYYLD